MGGGLGTFALQTARRVKREILSQLELPERDGGGLGRLVKGLLADNTLTCWVCMAAWDRQTPPCAHITRHGQ